MKNLVFIGMMGSAKTSTGKRVAKLLNMPFFDGDEVYEKVYGETISDTFATLGEQEFRSRETKIYEYLGAMEGVVISCGGGVVLKEENMLALKRNGVVVQMTATPEVIYERVSANDKRPLLREGGIEKVKEIMTARAHLYNKYADFSVNSGFVSPVKCAKMVVEKYKKLAK